MAEHKILAKLENERAKLYSQTCFLLGLRVQRRRVRASLVRIDPVGRAMRRRRVIYRRHYCVPHPNFLWWVPNDHSVLHYMYVP